MRMGWTEGDQERPPTRLADLQPMRTGGLGGAGAGRGRAMMSSTSWRTNHKLWDWGTTGEKGRSALGACSALLCSALLYCSAALRTRAMCGALGVQVRHRVCGWERIGRGAGCKKEKDMRQVIVLLAVSN